MIARPDPSVPRPDPPVLPAGSIFRINVGIFFEMLYKSPGILIKKQLVTYPNIRKAL